MKTLNVKSIIQQVASVAIALSMSPVVVQAGQINGGISFGGSYTAMDSANVVTLNLLNADRLVPTGNVVVDRNGDFLSIPLFTPTTSASFLDVNPAVVPVDPVWSVGGFSLTLSSMSEPSVTATTMRLEGQGTLHSTDPLLQDTPCFWIATFNTAGGTFTWSSSSAAVPCTGQIGDFVWQDDNKNGCQDAGEPGIPNVQVDLYSGCGANKVLLTTTTTDANGKYSFTGLCAGDYSVAFHTPAGYEHTLANQGCSVGGLPSDETDSDCNCTGTADCAVCVNLPTDSSSDLTIDCGYKCNGSIGDFVWLDTNGNGCQDAGEPGIEGVTVNLYSGCGANATQTATTTTDANGHYLFSGLCPGQYTVSFVTPLGYNRTLAHQSCGVPGGPPSNETDSDCDCDSGPCGICVTLPTAGGSSSDLTIDCGYIPSNPSLELEKTADKTVVNPGQPVTYTYKVTNTGSLPITGINIVDDNGTPGDTSDDYTVNAAPFDLAPGASMSFDIPHITEPICMTINGTTSTIGSLTINVLGNGDVEVWYIQSQGVNDNRYGTGATPATGWVSHHHNFSDLTGSDEATFQFTDKNGNVVLSFQEDYISAATKATFGDGVTINYPSGYGTLGPLGGDGKMLLGSAANVLSAHTTFSDTINATWPTFPNITVNSPPETSPDSGVSVPAGWNYDNGYYVKVSHLAFGAAGFGAVTIPNVHNSPSKFTVDKVSVTNICDCVTNTAVATGVAIVGGSSVSVSANDFEEVCPATSTAPPSGACNLAMGAIKLDKNTIQIPIKNNGSADIFMSDLSLTTWPSATNGKLKTVALNGTAWSGLKSPPATLSSADWVSDPTKRKIAKGQSKTLVLTFEKNVDKTAAHYHGGVVTFGTDSSCQLTFLP